MRILVAGANGKVGRQLVELWADTPHQVRAMVRDAAQGPRLAEHGAEILVADLEADVTQAVEGCDAVVFTAGSGGHTGPDKTILVDLDAAVRLVRAAEAGGVKRFLMVSAIGAANPAAGREKIRHYLVAKAIADRELAASTLRYTIVRPGRLNDEPGRGTICAGTEIGYGEISRADVARTLVECLEHENTYGKTFAILAGDQPIGRALDELT